MKIEPKPWCPLLKEECRKLDCGWFIQLRGKHPQTGADVDEWGCAVAWLPVLLIENAKEVRQGAAATESFRNEMVQANKDNAQLVTHLAVIKRLTDASH